MKPPFKYDGFDDAIIGIGHTSTSTELIVYSYNKIIECLMKDMSEDDAHDYASFNILGLHIGEGQPIILIELSPKEVLEHFEKLQKEQM